MEFLLGFSLFIIAIIGYKVNKTVGLSVDEIETKVETGIHEIENLSQEIEDTQKR